MAKDAEQLLQDLASADLDAIDSKIDELQRQTKTLTQLRRLVAVRQGKAEERARPSGRTNVLTVRKNLRKFLQAYGPATLDVIVKDLQVSQQLVVKALDSTKFIRDQSGRYRFYNG